MHRRTCVLQPPRVARRYQTLQCTTLCILENFSSFGGRPNVSAIINLPLSRKKERKKKNWQRQQCRVTNRGFESCANDFYFVFFSLFLFFLFFSPILAIEPATSLFISPTGWNSRTFAYSAKKNSLGDGMKEKYIVETDLLPELISRD